MIDWDWLPKALEFAITYLLDVIYGAWIAWTSPEFDWLRWMFLGGIIAGPMGYLARLEAEEAAQEDEDRARLAKMAAGEEEHNG